MALIFVFATISSPLHAQAMTGMSHAAPAQAAAKASMQVDGQMDGMSEECAKAMAAQAAKADTAKTQKHGSMDHSGGCCSDGCNCPLSHCPATPPMLAAFVSIGLGNRDQIAAGFTQQSVKSYLADTLKRPPRT
jgi:hypothetical protein